MSKKLLYIIPGHGAGDNGACKNGFQEAERVRALAQKIKDFGGDSVLLHDFALNSYKSNTIGKGLVPENATILELHLDSSVSKSAKGGHIIIYKKFQPDKYDNALAKMISEKFPGRSKIIDGRRDLANVNRAANKGYNYRLMECCFISNEDDIAKFNANIDEIAKEILTCCEIEVKEVSKPVATTTPTTKKKTVDELAREVMAGLHGNGHENRKASLAKQGYNNYEEVRARVNELNGVKATTTTPKVNYFTKYKGVSGSIVIALNSLRITSTFAYRKKIATANGIKLYSGSASQNTKLLNLLKQGKLIKP